MFTRRVEPTDAQPPMPLVSFSPVKVPKQDQAGNFTHDVRWPTPVFALQPAPPFWNWGFERLKRHQDQRPRFLSPVPDRVCRQLAATGASEVDHRCNRCAAMSAVFPARTPHSQVHLWKFSISKHGTPKHSEEDEEGAPGGGATLEG